MLLFYKLAGECSGQPGLINCYNFCSGVCVCEEFCSACWEMLKLSQRMLYLFSTHSIVHHLTLITLQCVVVFLTVTRRSDGNLKNMPDEGCKCNLPVRTTFWSLQLNCCVFLAQASLCPCIPSQRSSLFPPDRKTSSTRDYKHIH